MKKLVRKKMELLNMLLEFILDYQTILELKIWNAEGTSIEFLNLLLELFNGNAMQIKASYQLKNRVKLTEVNEPSSFWNREWF